MIGVVIGSYGMPSVVALGIAAIHHSNPWRPLILVHDDSTPDSKDINGLFQNQSSDFELYRTDRPLGHCAGDISCFVEGLKWAKAKGLKYLVKLSQRFIFYQPDWLIKTITLAKEVDAITMAQNAFHGPFRPWGLHGIRTECVLMKVEEWAKPEVYRYMKDARVTPEITLRSTAETFVHPGKPVARWRMLPPNKSDKREGILWHDANPESDYLELGKKLGVELPGYSNAQWKYLIGKEYKLS